MRVQFLPGAHFDKFSVNKNMQKRTKKKKIVSVAIIATSAYASVLFTLGMIVGYLGMRYFYKKCVKNGMPFIYVNIGRWKVHLHHWIFGGLIVAYLLLGGWQFENHKIFFGILCGIIAHDIYDFNDWHKVVLAKERV